MEKTRCECPYFCKRATRHDRLACFNRATEFCRAECEHCGYAKILEICTYCRKEYERWRDGGAHVTCFNPECDKRMMTESAWQVYGNSA